MLNEIKNIGVSGALGAAAGTLFANPVNGLVFGAVGRLVHEVTEPIFKEFDNTTFNSEVKNLITLGRFIAIIALSAAACTAVGFPLSFSTALLLQICQIAFVRIGKVLLTAVYNCNSPKAYSFIEMWGLDKSLVPATMLR